MSAPSETYAAIDLGSNSFHMVIAAVTDGRIQIIDRLKDVVRLGAGLDNKNRLDDATSERAIECLQKFGQRIKDIPSRNVRAVGTNTLRQAKNSNAFLKKARQALGHPVEIISGREEGRLIFSGVSYSNFSDSEKRLVIDIGGGSTELAIGKGNQAQLIESLYMGCVNMTSKYFPEGEISTKKMRKAILFARQELESIELVYKRTGWDTVFGSSGTIQTIRDLARNSGDDPAIRDEGLDKLKDAVIDAGHFKNLKFPNLDANRAPVLAGGLAILLAIFDALEIKSMQVSDGALREGLLLDMIGRQKNQDIREKTVEELISRYGIDREQAGRVEQISALCFEQLQQDMNLNPETDIKLLRWAARLHEIGLAIAHSQHHKHAGYLLNNSELAGFSREEQNYLALIVRSHRRKIAMEELESLADDTRQKIRHLIMLLRLAVVLNRSRAGHSYKELKISYKENRIKMKFPDNWLSTHPLTEADLALEVDYLKTLKVSLEFS